MSANFENKRGASVPYSWQTTLAGGVGGIASRTFIAPLDKVLKLGEEMDRFRVLSGGLQQRIVVKEAMTLYRGHFQKCVKSFSTIGIINSIYLAMTSQRGSSYHALSNDLSYRLMCGGIAAAVAHSITHPIDLLREMFAIASRLRGSTNNALSTLIYDKGSSGLFKGFGSAMLYGVPFTAIHYASVDVMRDFATDACGVDDSPVLLLGIGACAGFLANCVAYPVERLWQLARVPFQVREEAGPALVGAGGGSGMRGSKMMSMRVELPHVSQSVVPSAVGNINQYSRKGMGKRSNVLHFLAAGLRPSLIKAIPQTAVLTAVTGTLNKLFRENKSWQFDETLDGKARHAWKFSAACATVSADAQELLHTILVAFPTI
mmetsp:Transcript_24802/g.41324  ORF Transcript_24802/g.41324 Transcript_24802/m.41324 type:complete len:375 (-) Transcript_24802:2206-3330(-)